MSDIIGRITVPSLVSSGLTFPLTSDFGYGMSQSFPIVTHRFGQLDTKSEQRYAVGIGPQKFSFRRALLSWVNRNSLATFWEALQGSTKTFLYNVPNADQTTTSTTVVWENAPLSLSYLVNACQTGFNFIAIPSTNPSYSVASTCLRFPSSSLQTALLSGVQQIIPLIHIRVKESAVPDIYLSDRRCVVAGQQYLPRILGIGEPGGDTLITQDIKGTADNVQLQFGNADRVMTQLGNDTDLKYAEIDICLYHVNSGILLQLWKGFIQTFTSDGSNIFKVNCSDGMFQMMQQYPQQTISRTCWKTYNDGLNCPWASQGASGAAVTAAGGDPASCDFYWNSANGCLVHGMSLYFGGLPQVAQSVNVKDNSTGFLGFDRNTVTATSLVSDTMWGQALPEIWCNQQVNAVFAFVSNCIIAIVRDNGDYFDVFGVVGAGPLGSYSIVGNSAGEFVTNSDGYTYLCAPLADGYPAQGLKVADNGTSTSSNSALGLRQVSGTDPVVSSGSLTFHGTAWGTGTGDGSGLMDVFSIQNGTSLLNLIIDIAFPVVGLTVLIKDAFGNQVHAAPTGATAINIGHLIPSSTILSGDQFSILDTIYTITANVTTDSIGNAAVPFTPPLTIDVPDGTRISTSAFGLPYNQFDLANIVGTVAPTTEGADAKQTSLPFAAGVAFVELLYPKPSGFTPSAPEAHSMTVPIAQGLSGRVWDSGGVDSWVGGLIDPVWIAINSYLRAIGLTPRSTDSGGQIAAQLATFSLPDAVAASAICSTLVTPLLGTGTELQFQFQGVVGTQRPFRDWLTQILATGLGYYTFEFGQLKIGIRINASSVDAYTSGNILFQSLTLAPIEAAFEHLIISFADVAYQFQANTGEYVDKTHAAYYGRQNAPLTARQNVVGCSTLSQALRLAATRTREEIGGVNAAEWRNARDIAWKTTLLGLNNEVGQVVSITHPDVPGIRGVLSITSNVATFVSGDALDASMQNKVVFMGGVEYEVTTITVSGGVVVSIGFTPAAPNGTIAYNVITADARIQSWSLMKDYSVAIRAKTVTPSMYDLDVGPTPMDVLPTFPAAPLTSPGTFINSPLPWKPGAEPYTFADSGYSFAVDIGPLASFLGTGPVIPAGVVAIRGLSPVNTFTSLVARPQIDKLAVVAAGSSTLNGTVGGWFAVAYGFDSAGNPTASSNVCQVPQIPSANAYTFSFGVIWGAGTVSYEVYWGPDTNSLLGLGPQSGAPSTVVVSAPGPFKYGPPDPRATAALVSAKQVIHGGLQAVTVVGSNFSTHTVSVNVPSAPVANAFAGRYLIRLGGSAGTVATDSALLITASDTGYPTCNLTVPGFQLVTGGSFLSSLMLIGMKADTASPTTIGDSGFTSVFYPSGMTVNAEVGEIIRILYDPTTNYSEGATATVLSNTATVATTTPFTMPDGSIVTPGLGSVYIYEMPTWGPAVTAGIGANATQGNLLFFTLGDSLLSGTLALVRVLLSDSEGDLAEETTDVLRMIYVPTVSTAPSTTYVVPITSVGGIQTATPDASKGENLLVLTAAVCSTDANGKLFVNVAAPINYSITAGQSTPWSLTVQQDPVGMTGGYSCIFDPITGSYHLAFVVGGPAALANYQDVVDFKTDSTGITNPTGSLLGQPI